MAQSLEEYTVPISRGLSSHPGMGGICLDRPRIGRQAGLRIYFDLYVAVPITEATTHESGGLDNFVSQPFPIKPAHHSISLV